MCDRYLALIIIAIVMVTSLHAESFDPGIDTSTAVDMTTDTDINFDGHPDLILQTGEDGPYNQPTFNVYLFDPRTGRFVYSRDFSALSIQGTVKIDKQRSRITAQAEAGPGIFTAFLWRVSGNHPVLIKQEVWDTP
jgi:hypothetical protein